MKPINISNLHANTLPTNSQPLLNLTQQNIGTRGSHYSSIIQNKNLPEDYVRIINEIEEKRSKSKPRYQPSQGPQAQAQVSHQVINPALHISKVQGYSPSAPLTPPGMDKANINLRKYDQNVNYLEQLYNKGPPNQAILTPPLTNYAPPQQIPQQLFDLIDQAAPLNLNGPNLLQYYQQKFNILQVQQSQNQPTPQYSNFNSKTNLLTPPPVERQTQRKYSPRVNMQNIDDLYQVINKQVLHDFDKKPFAQISNQFKNISNIPMIQKQQQNHILKYNHQTMNNAATFVQKYLKGYIIRKRFMQFAKAYYFFKRIEKRVLVADIVVTMKETFMTLKNLKTQLLKNYVNNCATKIQKIFKGYYARNVQVKIKRAFKKLEAIFKGVVLGWRLRRIMKTKEIENSIAQIKDFQRAMNDLAGDMSVSEQKKQLQRNLRSSKYNTIAKMTNLIAKMQEKGLWLMYIQMERKERKSIVNNNSQQQQQQKDVFQVRKKKEGQKSSFLSIQESKKSPPQNHHRTPDQNSSSKKGQYLTIENAQPVTRSSHPQQFILLGMDEPPSIRSTADFTANKNSFNHLQQPSQAYCMDVCGYDQQKRMLDSYQSRDEMNLYSHKQNITTYDEVPIKSFSKESSSQSNTIYLTRSRFQPNFHSDAYKEQAKEIYKRRMHYNPREAASKSREGRNSTNLSHSYGGYSSSQLQSPPKSVSSKADIINFANQRTTNIEPYQDSQLRRKKEVLQDDRQPSINRSPESRKNNKSPQSKPFVEDRHPKEQKAELRYNFTPESYANKHKRRTRLERKGSGGGMGSGGSDHEKTVDTNIQMFDRSPNKGTTGDGKGASFKSTQNLFRKNNKV